MSKINYIICLLCWVLSACNNDENTIVLNTSLATLINSNDIEVDNVIACASGSGSDEDSIVAYVYPSPEATDIRYYETDNINVDKNDYSKYQRIPIKSTNLFNGYLRKFTRNTSKEKWVIITFFEEGKLHLSNPIRLQHKTKPTEFTSQVNINLATDSMPVFSWQDGVFDDNAIYFQVVSDSDNELLSGTYTFEKHFQYYKTENVVLNITMGTPPQLDAMGSYNFTLMGVSKDNWVNLLIQKEFQL